MTTLITVCRGCCCGTRDKHPDVDHDAQLRRLATAARVRASDCLGVCEHSNVVVVHPHPAARRAGSRPVWLGGVLAEAEVTAVAGWVAAGGPGRADLPEPLRPLAIRPPAPAAAR